MKIVVIDKDKSVRARLSHLIGDYSVCDIVGEFQSRHDVAQVLSLNQQIDVFFIGTILKDGSGIDMAMALREQRPDATIVFTANDEMYAAQAFELDAVDYLIKPITVTRFADTLRRMKERYLIDSPLERQPLIHVRDRGKHIFLGIDEVLFIEADQGILTVHTRKKRYLLDGSLKAIQEKYQNCFLRIHRKTLVNHQFIAGITRDDGVNMLHLHGAERLFAVSRRHVSNVSKWVRNLSA
ncbi:MAG: LytR/AlgR family response regulator transcription factor [Arenicella sp.]